MYVVGLTGGIGAGKSEAARMFSDLDVPVVDVDVISRHLTSAGQPLVSKIAEAFGTEYVTEDGAMDRGKIRDRIFNNNADRRMLESILHPAIHSEALRELEQYNQSPYQILAIPLFFESNPRTQATNTCTNNNNFHKCSLFSVICIQYKK